jgi:predicted phosphodiesterase
LPEYRFLALSDIHCPTVDWSAFNKVVHAIDEFNPDLIVLNGDLVEADYTSKHHPDERHKFGPHEEMDACAKVMKAINEAAPNAHRVWLYGNHDNSMFNYEPGRKGGKIIQTLRDSFTLRVVIPGHTKGWHIIQKYEHTVTWRIGQLTFRHGCDASDAGLRQDLYSYCTPHGLHISGHTHRPQQVTQLVQGKALTPFWFANTGCLMDVSQAYYMDRARKDLWGHAYIVGTVHAPGLKEGRQQYAGKRWEAETRIIRLFGENWAPNKVAN